MDDPQVYRALADRSRATLYERLQAAGPATVADLAAIVGLHPNTVRPHLDQLRRAGLVEMRTERHGVGRPRHVYAAVADRDQADALVRWVEAFLEMAAAAGVEPAHAASVGRRMGEEFAALPLEQASESFGFTCTRGVDGVHFTECPLRDLAAAHPQIVCGFHAGLLAGMLSGGDERVAAFHDVDDRYPCHAELERARGLADGKTLGPVRVGVVGVGTMPA